MQAAAKPLKPVTVIDTCITEPNTQLPALRGMPILDPQNSPAIVQGHQPTAPLIRWIGLANCANQAVCAPSGFSSIAVLVNSFHDCSQRRATGSTTMTSAARTPRRENPGP